MDTIRDEKQLDDAIDEALGMHSSEESAAYQARIAGDAAARRTDRQLRETTARMAAASPHLRPPAELRGRILQASAPRTFKMEEYRKATKEDYRFYKWGFYAAAMFLIMGAMYNINVGGKLDQANKDKAAIAQQANDLIKKQAVEFAMVNQQRDEALTAFVDPRGTPVTWTDPATKKPFGRGIINQATHKALLIFPQELFPAGAQGQLTLKGEDGAVVPYNTTVITAPADKLALVVPENAATIANMLKVQTLTPDEIGSGPQKAGFGGN